MDDRSIAFGRELLHQCGLSESILLRQDMQDISFQPDVLIASEVLEHLHDHELDEVLMIIKDKLGNDGVLLVTVPNGFGWFELESLLWVKAKIGWAIERFRIALVIRSLKAGILGCSEDEPYPPSTLSSSPQVQRFTYSSVQALLRKHHFVVQSISRSVLFAGPFSNLLFSGIEPIMKVNCLFGQWFPKVAAGFYLVCRPGRHSLT